MTLAIQLTKDTSYNSSSILINTVLEKLDEAIDDMEQGRAQPLAEAWQEIDAI